MMLKYLFIAGCGGFAGTCLRYLCGRLFHWLAPAAAFPWGTFVVNLAGGLLIGLFYGLSEKHHLLSAEASLFLITGLCGGLTTFSTFADELFLQLHGRAYALFAGYLLASVALGLLAVWAGRALVRG